MKLDENAISLQIAERIRSLATKQSRIPFLSGDLRKSIYALPLGRGTAVVGSNLSYARAVHDGRKAITIRPNIAKNPPLGRRGDYHPKSYYQKHPDRARLKFQIGGRTVYAREVHQPARKGRPFLREAVEELQKDGFSFLRKPLAKQFSAKIADSFIKQITIKM